jgi:hypothetical protein
MKRLILIAGVTSVLMGAFMFVNTHHPISRILMLLGIIMEIYAVFALLIPAWKKLAKA